MKIARPFFAMVRVQWMILARYPANLAAGLLTSAGGVLALALSVRLFAPADSAQAQILPGVMFYGYLLYAFLSDSLWRIGHSLRQDQLQGTLENLYLTPAPKFASLVSRVAPLLVITSSGVGLALLTATAVLGGLPSANLGLAVVILVFALSGTVGLGFCFAAYTLIAGDTAASTGNLIEFGLLVACAMFFPFRALPGPVLWVSRLIPLSYCVDAFRSALLDFPAGFPELAPFGREVAVVIAFGLAFPLLGYALFRLVERRLRSNGRLGNY